MKTIFTLFASMFLGISAFAADARNAGTLTIRNNSNSEIKVVLDGKRFEPNGNAIILSNLDAGTHSVKVYRQKNSGFINILGKRFELVYNNYISVKKRTSTVLTIDRNGYNSIAETRINRNYDRNDDWSNDRNNDRNNDWDNDYARNDNQYDFERDGKFGDYDQHEGYMSAMSDREFRTVLSQISKEWLESNKLKSATQVARTNNMTTAQVKEMMMLFSFENNKLDLAKTAFNNVVDKSNYRSLYECFTYNSSKNELEKFTRYGRF